MSQENVEIVRRAIEAFNRRDLDAHFVTPHPDVEVDWSRSDGVRPASIADARGREGFGHVPRDVGIESTSCRREASSTATSVIVRDRTRLWGRDGIEVERRNVAS